MPILETTIKTVKCKNCGSEAVVKYGSYKGVPCFLCKSCNRKFKADDNLAGMRVPTKEIASALNLYYDGSSVRAIGRHFQQEIGHTPSTASIYEWIQRYSQYLTESTKDYHPNVGNEWVADETVLKIGGQNVWLWDIIDSKTRFLIATHMSYTRTSKDAEQLMKQAYERTGKIPRVIYTDKLRAYLEGIERVFGADTSHRQGAPFDVENNTNYIESMHGTIKSRTKVMRGLHTIDSPHASFF